MQLIINVLGSDTDISTSNENLSMEQRYVLRHTPRVEPQGQENLVDQNTGDTLITMPINLNSNSIDLLNMYQ